MIIVFTEWIRPFVVTMMTLCPPKVSSEVVLLAYRTDFWYTIIHDASYLLS